jgi:predicted deacylase
MNGFFRLYSFKESHDRDRKAEISVSCVVKCGPGSSVVIATGLDGPGMGSR